MNPARSPQPNAQASAAARRCTRYSHRLNQSRVGRVFEAHLGLQRVPVGLADSTHPTACLNSTWHRPCRTRRVTLMSRDGMTLLEIILALTIFFGAMAALSQLAWNGSRAAVQARLKTQAIIRCEAKLAEVIARVEALQPKTRFPFPDNAQWTYSINVTESQYPDLLQIHVTVAHTGNSSLANVEFSLSRWMRDPGIFRDAAELQKTEAKKESQKQGATR